jgi:antitoxin component of MazEF toxin-antitoxin module
MIKISNLNFQNQTIKTIKVDVETVDNLEIKWTKTKFDIVIVRDNKIIKKETKKKDVPELLDLVIEKTDSHGIEDIKEEVEDDIKEKI